MLLTALPLAAAAVGYVLLAVAGATFLIAVALLLAYRRRADSAVQAPVQSEPAPEPVAEPAPAPRSPTTGRDAAHLDSVTSLSMSLAHAEDPEAIARVLLHEVVRLLRIQFAALALISEDGKEATGLYARGEGADVDWWTSVRIDLEHDPSGIASSVFEAASVAIYDVESSPRSTVLSPSGSGPRASPSCRSSPVTA